MIYLASSATSLTYKKLVKPILFKFSPDSVHKGTTRLSTVVSKIPPLLWIIKACFAYKNESFLGQTVNGLYYENPIGLSAGFDKNFELLRFLPALGFGFIEGGSLTNKASTGNPRPHYHRLKKSRSILVNAGLNNDGVNTIVKRINSYGSIGYPLNISVAKTNSSDSCTDELGVADYIASLKTIKTAQVGNVITLNISCPNAYGGEPFTTPERLEKLLAQVDKLKLTQPIQVKMPIDLAWPEFDKLLQVIIRHNVAGVTIGNLAKNRNNPNLLDELTQAHKGNMSGKPTCELSNELIDQTYKKYGKKLIIIGVGGVFSANDAYEKIKRGATLVELITGLIFEGPQVIGSINKGLVDLAKKDGYSHISEVIGTYHSKT